MTDLIETGATTYNISRNLLIEEYAYDQYIIVKTYWSDEPESAVYKITTRELMRNIRNPKTPSHVVKMIGLECEDRKDRYSYVMLTAEGYEAACLGGYGYMNSVHRYECFVEEEELVAPPKGAKVVLINWYTNSIVDAETLEPIQEYKQLRDVICASSYNMDRVEAGVNACGDLKCIDKYPTRMVNKYVSYYVPGNGDSTTLYVRLDALPDRIRNKMMSNDYWKAWGDEDELDVVFRHLGLNSPLYTEAEREARMKEEQYY